MNDGRYKPLAELTPEEMLARSREYRLLAATSTTAGVREALLGMARVLERRAAEKEGFGWAYWVYCGPGGMQLVRGARRETDHRRAPERGDRRGTRVASPRRRAGPA